MVDRVRADDVRTRHAVTRFGDGSEVPLIFAHGFGTDQTMWRHFTPRFAEKHPVLTFDHVGCGASDLSAYHPGRYATLRGYADDVVELLDTLGDDRPVYIGHSASGMIGLLASLRRPEAPRAIVLIGASPRYLNDSEYVGGFSRDDVDELLDAMESNWHAWGQAMAPFVMANPDHPELAAELAASFERSHAAMAHEFARAIFLSDYRAELAEVDVPVLVLQSTDDPMVPAEVGRYLYEHLPNSTLVPLEATGHYPHLSAIEETSGAITRFVGELV